MRHRSIRHDLASEPETGCTRKGQALQAPLEVLTLRALAFVETSDGWRWRWVLEGPSQEFIAAADAELPSAGWRSPHSLPAQLARSQIRDDPTSSGQAMLSYGKWLGGAFSDPLATALTRDSPRHVVLVVQPGSEALQQLPWTLAWISGQWLWRRGVTFSVAANSNDDVSLQRAVVTPVGSLLLVSASPATEAPLALTEERERLKAVVAQARAASAAPLKVGVLQYGVTVERLREVLTSGWDVLHFSCHGQAGRLIVETAEGSSHPLSRDALVALLRASGVTPRLVGISSCSSGAEVRHQDSAQRVSDIALPGASLLLAVSQELHCSVWGMRWPIPDEQAIQFTSDVYARLLVQGQSLYYAFHQATLSLTEGHSLPKAALAAGTPVLVVPGEPHEPEALRALPTSGLNDYIPRERLPSHVGRVPLITDLLSLLLREEGQSVLLVGAPGVGKSALLRELHAVLPDDVRYVRWSPREVGQRGGVRHPARLLRDLAEALGISAATTSGQSSQELLGELRRATTTGRVLLAIDDADELLAPALGARALVWGGVLSGLARLLEPAHLLVLVRQRPRRIPHGFFTKVLEPLSAVEAQSLLTKLPRLRNLIQPAGFLDVDEQGVALLTRTVNAFDGVPALLHLADGHASHRSDYEAWLATYEPTITESVNLTRLANSTAIQLEPPLRALFTWVQQVVSRVSAEASRTFSLLCALEAKDRRVEALLLCAEELGWGRLNLAPALQQLAEAGLLTKVWDESDRAELWRISPPVAAAGRPLDGSLQAASDLIMSRMYWNYSFELAQGKNASNRSPEILMRGLPYLGRLRAWSEINVCVEDAISFSQSREVAKEATRWLDAACEAVAGTEDESRFFAMRARAYYMVDASLGLPLLQESLEMANGHEDRRLQAAIETDIRQCLVELGLFHQLPAAVQRVTHPEVGDDGEAGAKRASSLDIDFLAAVTQDLLPRLERGEPPVALRKEILHLWNSMPSPLPDLVSGNGSGIKHYMVIEQLLQAGRIVAVQCRDWELALQFGQQATETRRARGADQVIIARSALEEGVPLAELGLCEEATALVDECALVLTQDPVDLMSIYHTRAIIAQREGRPEEVCTFLRAVVRQACLSRDERRVAGSLLDLSAGEVLSGPGDRADVLAYLLGALFLARRSGLDRIAELVKGLFSKLDEKFKEREPLAHILQVSTTRLEAVLDPGVFNQNVFSDKVEALLAELFEGEE